MTATRKDHWSTYRSRNNEENLSTQQSEKEKNARLPQADEHKGGKENIEQAQGKGKTAPHRLIAALYLRDEEHGGVDGREHDERLPKTLRLAKRREFDRVFKAGRRVKLPGLTIIYASNGKAVSRLGISVSKRRLPKAVQRNRAKRISRELFRRNKDLFGEGYDFIFLLGKKFLDHPYTQYCEWIRKALDKRKGWMS